MKFISGSNRIREGFNIKIKVEINRHSDTNKIPSSATCFRKLYLDGNYSSEEELKNKLLYALENCNEIAESYNNYTLDADFGL